MLLEDLQEVAVSWLIIGLYLKIPYYKLNIIKEDNRGCVICLTAMLDSWLTGNGVPATPAALVQALNTAGTVDLAKRIATKYGKKSFMHCDMTHYRMSWCMCICIYSKVLIVHV